VCSREILDILNSCEALETCDILGNVQPTFGENLPLAGLASWRVR
jgi:hypothetical protein